MLLTATLQGEGSPLKPGFGTSGDVQISSILSSRPEQITAKAVTCGVEGPVSIVCIEGVAGAPFLARLLREKWVRVMTS